MGWKTGWFGALLLGGLLAACASVPPPPPTPEPVRPPPEPRPPYGAALNLPVPNPGPDGQFATVNSDIGPKETIWHLRAAFNVAALACGDGKAITSAYNRFLADRKQVLKKAWAAETSQHGRATLDRHMTLLYNYFAQPPALPGFCRAASAEVIRLSAVPPADFESYAGAALARLEAPIVAFYRAYHQYREDLAAWRATHGKEAAAASAASPTAEGVAADNPGTGEGWRIQIGAYTGRKAAEAAWEQVRRSAPGLAAYRPYYEEAPGRRGLVRVQLGSGSSRAAALALCASAAAGGFDCLPVNR